MVKEWLADDPALKSVEILHRMRQKGYEGQRTAAYGLIAGIRRRVVRYVMRFEGLPGEFTQHDFGEVVIQYTDGRRQKIHFFATRLKFSRWVEVTIVPNQQAETLIRTMFDHFAAIGGLPLLAVFDRPKTIAMEWSKDGTVTKWNQTFAQAMFGLGLGVELCWPYSPEQKGAAENLVGWVKGSFFTQRRFVDYDDMLQQLVEWQYWVNNERPCRATGVIPARRLEVERCRLRPLRIEPDEFALQFQAGIGPTAEVSFEGTVYSMPPDAVGLPAELHVFPQRIRIVAGRHDAEHPRLESGGRSILPEHRAQQVAAVSGKRGKRYLKRQHLLELGGDALTYLSEIVHRRPNAWYRDVETMHHMLQQEGDEALRTAINRALRDKVYGGEYIRWFIKHPEDAQPAVDR
jgi:transposase